MDEQTALVLALQLVALFSIAGALLLYLLCKIKTTGPGNESSGSSHGGGRAVLVTCTDTALGLQIAIHLANGGFRVFAGLKDPSETCTSSKVMRAWQKYRDGLNEGGALVTLPFDVTREDLLHEAVDIIRAHLPAGEDGIWAVVNTSGLSYRGRLEHQDIAHWDAILRTNVVGVLRTARTFHGLLRNTRGRILNFGAVPETSEAAGLVAYTASRYAVEGASKALRQEFAPLDIKIVTLQPSGCTPEMLFSTPKTKGDVGEISVDISGCIDYQPMVLNKTALEVLDVAVGAKNPKHSYTLSPKNCWMRPFQSLSQGIVT